MDITQAETIAVAIVGLVAPVFVQVVKPILPDNMTALFSLAAVGGFNHGYTWGVLLVAVVGVSQTVYTAVNQVMGGKLGKTFVDENKLP